MKWGSFYGRWTTPDGRRVNRRIGKVRVRGESDGLTRAQAELGLRRLIEAESLRPRPAVEERPRTVHEVADELRGRLAIEGARLSYQQNCESTQRVHISPAIGKRRVDSITRTDVERLARSMLERSLAPKTVRNVMTFLHSVFALAVESAWTAWDAARRAVGPPRRPLPRSRRTRTEDVDETDLSVLDDRRVDGGDDDVLVVLLLHVIDRLEPKHAWRHVTAESDHDPQPPQERPLGQRAHWDSSLSTRGLLRRAEDRQPLAIGE